MSRHNDGTGSTVSVSLEWKEGLTFSLAFDGTPLDTMLIDETHEVHELVGPTPSRLLAAAVAGCLSSSLLFCLSKKGLSPGTFTARAEVSSGRNETGRLRITGITVRLVPSSTDPAVVKRLEECKNFFETYCTVTESIRHGIPVTVEIDAGE